MVHSFQRKKQQQHINEYIEMSKTKRDCYLFIYAIFFNKYLNERKKSTHGTTGKKFKNTNGMLRFRSIFNNSAKLRKNGEEPVKRTDRNVL